MKKFLLTIFIFSLAALPAAAQEVGDFNPQDGLTVTGEQAGIIESGQKAPDLPTYIGLAINGLFGFVAIVFIVTIMVGGLKWMQAMGNEEQVMGSKKIILNGIFGLMVIFLAYALVWVITIALGSAAITGNQ